MRIDLWTLVLVLVVSSAFPAQLTTPLDSKLTDILNRMENKDGEARETAFDEISNLWAGGVGTAQHVDGSGIEGNRNTLTTFLAQHPDEADRVKIGLIRLLQTENNKIKIARPGSMSEDYGEYVFALTQTVSALKDDRAITVLVDAISRSGVDLLRFGDKALEPVLGQLKNSDALVRTRALEIGLKILQARSDPASRARARALILSSLDDHSIVVRRAAVRGIACLDDRDTFVPTLNKITRNDPSKLPGKALDGGDGNEFYPVRYDARRVLRDIEDNKTCP
jgi:hypothetical protein